MSKYQDLWHYVGRQEGESLLLSYEDIQRIAGVPLDHSFLSYKKELSAYGWKVDKISMKNQTVSFRKMI